MRASSARSLFHGALGCMTCINQAFFLAAHPWVSRPSDSILRHCVDQYASVLSTLDICFIAGLKIDGDDPRSRTLYAHLAVQLSLRVPISVFLLDAGPVLNEPVTLTNK